MANEYFKGDTEEERICSLYKYLNKGWKIQFDLCKTRVRMVKTRSQRMINREDMMRSVSFPGKTNYYSRND